MTEETRRRATVCEILSLAAELVPGQVATDLEERMERGLPSEDLRVVEDLGLDSVTLLTLAVEVEDHFKVCLDADDEEAIVTLGDLADIVLRRKSSTGTTL